MKESQNSSLTFGEWQKEIEAGIAASLHGEEEERELAQIFETLKQATVEYMAQLTYLLAFPQDETDAEHGNSNRSSETLARYAARLASFAELGVANIPELAKIRPIYKAIILRERETLLSLLPLLNSEDEYKTIGAFTAIQTFAVLSEKHHSDPVKLWSVYSNDIPWDEYPDPDDAEKDVIQFFAMTGLWKSKNNLPDFKRVRAPQQLLIPVSKVAKAPFTPVFWKGAQVRSGRIGQAQYIQTKVKNKGSKGVAVPVDNILTVEYPNGAPSPFEWCVHAAIASEYNAGNDFFTAAMLYRTMTGGSSTSRKPSQQMEREIESAIRNLMSGLVSVDFTEEARKRGFAEQNDETFKITGNFAYLKEGERTQANGMTLRGYTILGLSPLSEYSAKTGQVCSIPQKVLDVREIAANGKCMGAPIPNTRTAIALKMYIAERIEGMKNSKNGLVSNRIALEASKEGRRSIYSVAEAQEGDKKKKKAVRDICAKILGYLVGIGYIENFTAIKSGNSYVAYDIELKQQQPIDKKR